MASTARASVVRRVMALLPIALLALVLPPAAAQVPFLGKCPDKSVVQNFNVTAYLGKCPDKSVVQNFNVTAYLGKWYEQERYFAVFQLGGNCVTATYTDEGDGVVGVNNAQTNLVSGRKNSVQGKATLVGGEGEAKLEVRFQSVGNIAAPYWVLDTDYENYAIVWSCTSLIGISNVQFAWVLTRAKNPGVEVMAGVRESLDARHVELIPFRRTLQVCDDN